MKDQDKVRRIVPILHWQNVNVQCWYCLNYCLVDQDRNVVLGASRLIAIPMYVILRKVVASEAFKFQVVWIFFNLLVPSRFLFGSTLLAY